jgi:hypothetical protein
MLSRWFSHETFGECLCRLAIGMRRMNRATSLDGTENLRTNI